ncbi:MAG TPA: alpha-amylase family glycosyl hydrolase, partial [Roseiflexaceae bacterium]
MIERRLADLDFAALTDREFFRSPVAWEDQVLYFLMLDRFSDGNEQGYRDNAGAIVAGGTTPLFRPEDAGSAVRIDEDAVRWREAGSRFVGGTLKGLTSKIGYLKRLGITAIWVSPVFRQVAAQQSYHGYGIQNFLDVDPRFGTREDLREMVATAHEHGIYVILDIIFNHVGDIFDYDADRYAANASDGSVSFDTYWDGQPYRVKGFRDRQGQLSLPFGPVDLGAYPDAWPDGAIWPAEFQDAMVFTQKGYIRGWDNDPEYLEGDFFSLKDVTHGRGDTDNYQPAAALRAIVDVYKFWMAYADVDGYRIDTVKHMDPGATRFFASAMHEFAQRLGKENF